MTDVQPLSYLAISWAVRQINAFLLKSQGGVVLRVTIDKYRNVVAVDLVSVAEALAGGFEPVNLTTPDAPLRAK